MFLFWLLCLKLAVQKLENSEKNFSFDNHTPLSFLHAENDFSGVSIEKAFYQNVEKHPFLGHFTQLPAPGPKIEKTAPMHWSSDKISKNLKSFR